MSKHTPGPWSVGQTRKSSVSAFSHIETLIHVGDERPGNALAIVYLGGPGATSLDRADVEANAKFIVQACNSHDDLLAACKAARDACQDNLKAYQYKNEPLLLAAFNACQDAIAKAEGRTNG